MDKEEVEKEYKGVIYKVTNKVNGKCYIGRAFNWDRRRKEHIRASFSDSEGYPKNQINLAIRKYGVDSFAYEVICECNEPTKAQLDDVLNKLEIFYIDKYNSFYTGYNQTKGCSGSSGRIVGEVTRKKMSKIHKGKKLSEDQKKEISRRNKELMTGANNPMYGKKGELNPFYGKKHTMESRLVISEKAKGRVQSQESINKAVAKREKHIVQYSMDGKCVCEWNSSKIAGKNLGMDSSSITKCCRGKIKTAYGFIWRYRGDAFDKYSRTNNGKKPVVQYSVNGDIVARWASATDASIVFNTNNKSISACCLGRSLTAGGYVWRFEGDPFDKYRIIAKTTPVKPISQYSKNGEFIKDWESITKASKDLLICSGDIIKCCKGKNNTAGGYVWKYKAE